MSQYRLLVYAILDKALKDVQEGNKGQAIDAVGFFDGDFFEDLADAIGLDIKSTRTMVSDCFRERCKHWYWQAGKEYRIKSKDFRVFPNISKASGV